MLLSNSALKSSSSKLGRGADFCLSFEGGAGEEARAASDMDGAGESGKTSIEKYVYKAYETVQAESLGGYGLHRRQLLGNPVSPG